MLWTLFAIKDFLLRVSCRHYFELEEVYQGDSITLKHSGWAKSVTWYGPAFDYIDSKSIDLRDAYGRETSWKTIPYTENTLFKSSALVPNFLAIVGNHVNGEYYLHISNMTQEHEGLYYCNIKTNNGTIRTFQDRSVVRIRDEEKLKILYEPSQRLTEGGNVTICCISKRLLPREYLRWFVKGNIIRKEVNETCLLLTNVDRNDYTTFVCLAEEGTAIKQATVNIFYPPVVSIWHSTDATGNRFSNILCKADGNPNNYTFKRWEHLSLLNEHIRYIDSPEILRFRLDVHSTNWNQDDGYYICRVSNGIPDNNGTLFQKGTKRITSKGPPIFVTDNMAVQYSDEKESKIITVNVMNVSALNCTKCDYATQAHSKKLMIYIELHQVMTWDTVYGRRIQVFGTKIIFSIFNGNFSRYVLTVCDRFGSNSYEVDLRSSSENGIGLASVIAILCTLVFGTILVLFMLVIVVIYGLKKDRKHGYFDAVRTGERGEEHSQIEIQENVVISGPALHDSGEVNRSALVNRELNPDTQCSNEIFRGTGRQTACLYAGGLEEHRAKCSPGYYNDDIHTRSFENISDYYNVDTLTRHVEDIEGFHNVDIQTGTRRDIQGYNNVNTHTDSLEKGPIYHNAETTQTKYIEGNSSRCNLDTQTRSFEDSQDYYNIDTKTSGLENIPGYYKVDTQTDSLERGPIHFKTENTQTHSVEESLSHCYIDTQIHSLEKFPGFYNVDTQKAGPERNSHIDTKKELGEDVPYNNNVDTQTGLLERDPIYHNTENTQAQFVEESSSHFYIDTQIRSLEDIADNYNIETRAVSLEGSPGYYNVDTETEGLKGNPDYYNIDTYK